MLLRTTPIVHTKRAIAKSYYYGISFVCNYDNTIKVKRPQVSILRLSYHGTLSNRSL